MCEQATDISLYRNVNDRCHASSIPGVQTLRLSAAIFAPITSLLSSSQGFLLVEGTVLVHREQNIELPASHA